MGNNIVAIYRNALGRDGDSEGINYWTGELEGRYGKIMSRSDMVSIFIEAALVSDLTHENYPNHSGADPASAVLWQDLHHQQSDCRSCLCIVVC